MINLALIKKTMSSLEIAELTGKQHAHVMRDIRNILEQGVSESNFGLSSYKQAQPNGGVKDVSCYNLTKKGCLILASGYDAKLREKIIDRWEELETCNCLSRKELALMIIQAEEEKEQMSLALEQKTEQLDESKEWYSIKRWAKEHKMNWRSINWRKMKALSFGLGYEIKKIFDGNYGQVNIYHKKVFELYFHK